MAVGARYGGPGGTYVYDLASATPTVPVATLKDPEVLDRLAKAGWVPDSIDGDAFRQFAVDELNVLKSVAKSAKIEISE